MRFDFRPIIAGTGHRPKRITAGGEDAFSPRVSARLAALASAAITRYRPARIISGMALGWDTALAEAAAESGVPFDAYVPFGGQERRWPPASQVRYRRLLAKAERVVIVSAGGFSAAAMEARNRAMVDAADAVLAMWDGSHRGGTGSCVRYAADAGVPVVNLWRHWVRHA